MASDRDKLALDEQSFEGLLAAAFTIQQHNARMNAAGASPQKAAGASPQKNEAADQGSPATPEAKPDVLICGGCGAALPSAGATCQKCGRTNFRPGERLQRNWASLWQMSQEHGTGLETRPKPEDELPLSPADPGRVHAGSEIPEATDHAPDAANQTASSATEHATPASSRIQKVAERQADEFVSPENFAEPTETRTLDLAKEDEDRPEEAAEITASEPMEAEAEDSPESSHHNEEIARDSIAVRDDSGAEEQALVRDVVLRNVSMDRHGETEEAWHQATPHAGDNIFAVLRARVAAHRADIFLGLAVIIAAGALLWPTGAESGPKMAPWERALVAVGIAEAPRPAVHFYGDPELKVWVDTHTALYYCPGDELYGKSLPDGHYTTQREAQADQFEPAQRSVCIE